MDEQAEDDIDILNLEKADKNHKRDGEIPVPMYTGEESIASHFALVTAYEDIKKRLKETEKENSFLKKRVRWLEEKVLGSRLEGTTCSVGPEQVNKAYKAYREACIERDNLKIKLDNMMKENTESLKLMNEQLQSKEVELLQLRTEVETQQVMKSLTCNPSSWEIDKLNNALKVHSLEKDLEKLREECNDLRKQFKTSIQKGQSHEGTLINGEFLQHENIHRENLQQAYRELKREMSNLHAVTDVQAEVLRKLKRIPSETKPVSSCAPIQCIEDLERDFTNLHFGASGVTFKKRLFVPNDQVFSTAVSSPSSADERLIPVCNSPCQEHNSYGKCSLEDNSWVFPSPPKPSETMFWEMKSKTSPLNFSENNLDQCNQNCLHKT